MISSRLWVPTYKLVSRQIVKNTGRGQAFVRTDKTPLGTFTARVRVPDFSLSSHSASSFLL